MITKATIRGTFVYAVVIACSALYHVSGLGYYDGASLERITYMFSHANLLHFSVNILAFFLMAELLKETPFLFTAFPVAFLATYGSEMAMPTIGLSGVIYAMFGSAFCFYDKPTRIRLALTSILCNGIMLCGGNVNVMLHALCFVYSLITTSIYVFIKRRGIF